MWLYKPIITNFQDLFWRFCPFLAFLPCQKDMAYFYYGYYSWGLGISLLYCQFT
jgi:hypothetical protein